MKPIDEIIVDLDHNLPEDNIANDTLLSLIDAKTKLKVINDGKNKISNVKDMANDILKENVINKSLVSSLHGYISDVFNTFEEKVVLESFTEAPSTIMLEELKDEVDTFLDTELKELDALSTSLKEVELNKTLEYINKYLEVDYSDYRLLVDKLSKVAEVLLGKISSDKESIIPVKSNDETKFIDITTVNLKELTEYDDIDLENKDKFIESIKSILSITDKDSYSKFLFHSLVKSKEMETLPSLVDQINYKDDIITISDVIKFFNSSSLKLAIHNADKQLLEIKEYLENDKDDFLSQSVVLEEQVTRSINIFSFILLVHRLFGPSINIFNQLNNLLSRESS